jgi:lincosamide nucleotidyltransferase A/C/D/E
VRAGDVVALLDALDARDVDCWLDGGWGVDALLGEQTREHGDVDLVVRRGDLPAVAAVLGGRGYVVVRDWRPTSLAWRDAEGREVDLHPVDPTPDGGGDQVLEDGGRWHYEAPVAGTVAGRAVRCAGVGEQLRMHEGYPLRDTDRADVLRLRERFPEVG